MSDTPINLQNMVGSDVNPLQRVLHGNEFNEIIDELDITDQSMYCKDSDLINILNANTNSFNVLSLNCQSLNSKFDQLLIYLQMLESHGHNFSAICLQETWLSPDVDLHLFQLENYNLISKGTSISKHGGLAIYLHKSYCYSELNNTCASEVSEKQFIEVTGNGLKSNIILGNFYRPPKDCNENYQTFINELSSVLESFQSTKFEIIITGDFNIDLLKINERPIFNEFLDLILLNGFLPKITLPTRFSQNHGTLIDNIFYKLSHNNSTTTAGILLNNISDHQPYFMCLNCSKLKNKINKYIDIHKYPNNFEENVKTEISGISIPQCQDPNPNESYNFLQQRISSAIDKYRITKKVKYRKHKHKKCEWITSGIIRSIRFRDRLYFKLKNAPRDSEIFETLKQNHRTYNKVLKRTIKLAKYFYYKNIFEKFKHDAKLTWKNISCLLNRTKGKSDYIESLHIGDQLVTDKTDMANKFNQHFIEIGEKLSDFRNKTQDNSFFDYLNNPVSESFCFKEINKEQVLSIIDKLKTKSSCSYDGISTKLLKAIKEEIAIPMTEIINQSINSGIFPDNLKIARVNPILKKGDKSLMENYRPISILPALSKIFEKVLHSQLHEYFENNNLYFSSQYGFRERHSTELAALELIDRITLAMDQNETPINIYIDLSKAFDSINHDILLSKLQYYGIHGISLKLCSSYLTNRKQYVQIDDDKSHLLNIVTGIPQGSVLGPLLFIIFINDLAMASKYFHMINYADDTTLFASYKAHSQSDNSNIDRTLNSELSKIDLWLKVNKLAINTSKTKYMIFRTNKKNLYLPVIKLNEMDLECVQEFNFLGMTITENLNWNSHINKIASKITKTVGIIHRLKFIIPQQILRTIYDALILPHLNYGILCWGSQTNRLSKIQKNAIRKISLSKYNAHTDPLFKSFNLLKINDIYTICQLKFYFKFKHQMLPKFFMNNFVQYNNQFSTYVTRGFYDLSIPKHHHAFFERSLRYVIVKTINDSSRSIIEKVNTHSFNGFTSYAKKYFLSNYHTECTINNCYVCGCT